MNVVEPDDDAVQAPGTGGSAKDVPVNAGAVVGLTEFLRAAAAGDREAMNHAFDFLYPELLRIARKLMQTQPSHHTLDPEGVVHEAFIKVTQGAPAEWQSRGHYLAVMSRAMRQVLVDHARGKNRAKRGGGMARVPLTGLDLRFEDLTVDLLTLHEALEAYREVDPDGARVLELTYFGGFSAAEVAETMGVSARTVQRDLEYARTWIRGWLSA